MNSFFFQAFWIMMLAGIGGKAQRNAAETNLVVASFMLYTFFYNVRFQTLVR